MKIQGKLSVRVNEIIDRLPCGSRESTREELKLLISEMSKDFDVTKVQSWATIWLDKEIE